MKYLERTFPRTDISPQVSNKALNIFVSIPFSLPFYVPFFGRVLSFLMEYLERTFPHTDISPQINLFNTLNIFKSLFPYLYAVLSHPFIGKSSELCNGIFRKNISAHRHLPSDQFI